MGAPVRYSFADAYQQALTTYYPLVWGSVFAVPDALTGLAATYDEATGAVILTWDASALPAAEFARYVVYRGVDDGPMLRIDDDTLAGTLLTDQADPTFTDWEAPIGRTLRYRVAVTNGALESEPIEVQTTVPLYGVFFGIPGDDRLMRRLQWTRSGATQARAKRQTVKQPLGRSTYLATTGPTMLASGRLTVDIWPGDTEELMLLREVSELVPDTHAYAVLRNELGDVHRVILGTITETLGDGGLVASAGFDWWTVRLPAGEG